MVSSLCCDLYCAMHYEVVDSVLRRGQDEARRVRDRAGATHGLSGRLKAERTGSLPPEVEVWAAFRFVPSVDTSGLFFYCFLLFSGENWPER